MNRKPKSTTPNTRKFSKSRFPHDIFLESFGVKIRIGSNEIAAINAIREKLPSLLPNCYRLIDGVEVDHEFLYVWNRSNQDSLYKNKEILSARVPRELLLDVIGTQIRLTVAEFAVEKVFVHAGVVSWKGKAIVIPAKTFKGKSTLTAELVRRGALYYSDEYAVFDKNGLVSPFPKMLSIRGEIDEYTQVDHTVESLGGTAGTETIRVGMVLMTEYKKNAKWEPKILTSGKGLIEMLRDTIPIRNDPAFTLAVLKQVTENSVIVKSPRRDASESADRILEFFETKCLQKNRHG